MSKQDAEQLRQLAGFVQMSEPQRDALQRIASQLESDAKRYEDSCKLQEIGKSAMGLIADMVAALDCDYDRLEELRTARNECRAAEARGDEGPCMSDDDGHELAELEAAADECKNREDAEQRIHEDPLSVQVRGPWYDMAANRGASFAPEEFEILLGTGGPAMRIIGELNEHGEPTRARLQAQDWCQPWTDYVQADQDTLLSYCRCFYFGEG